MTWKDRLALGLCGRAGCPLKAADGANYCSPHRDDQRTRNAQHMRFKRAQLALPFVHISSSH